MDAAHAQRAEALAEKIARKAVDALAHVEHEMRTKKWPPEFRAIMWDAIARTAAARALEQEARTE